MKPLWRRKGRLAVIGVCGIAITAFCIEYLTYIYNASTWHDLRRGGRNADDVLARVLFVADPQIQGEQKENIFFGWLFRWDADRYLQRNYQLVKHHISPDVIVFLGDLFDEGSIANDPEYRRYYQRFSSIFDLPTNQNPSSIKYIFVPGDNDIGGESTEPVDEVKLSWFSKTFGDVKSITDFNNNGLHVQFLKMNLFIPNEYKNPFQGLENVINGTKKPDVRLLVSHVSLLSFLTDSVKQVVDTFKPDLIFAAHSHKSSFLSYKAKEGNWKESVHIYHEFLLPEHSYLTTSDPDIEQDVEKIEKELKSQTSIKLNLKQSSDYIREIMVPTCSYRMGTNKMGYGAMYLYSNGTVEYTVLWLPSRFKQLFLYAAVYFVVKIILTPILFWKICTFMFAKAREFRILERTNAYTKIV